MCGFVGFMNALACQAPDAARYTLFRMSEAIKSRGPDDLGVWHSQDSGLGLAHRRLAIIDLSPAGHQPMMCAFDRFVIAFNGEIYNHLELRRDLELSGKHSSWRGCSDTETLLAGFNAWGVRATVERCIGMFAFAVWDSRERVLVLARDRVGEKPVYYGWQGSGEDRTFLFGSDLSSLKVHPAFDKEISRDALCLFVQHNYISSPHSIFKNVCKLPPGHLLVLAEGQDTPLLECYWSLPENAMSWVAKPYEGGAECAVNDLELLLKDAIRQQMVADVPLGAFLSGGIDSSTVVALMQAQSGRPVKTFSIGFNEDAYNEAKHASAVAKHLGTDHTELYVTSDQAQDVIPKIPTLYSEPFADSSQIPTYLVSQLARQQVTVSLSGDAGDELFAGYNRYLMTRSIWGKVGRLPKPLRAITAGLMRSVSPQLWNNLLTPVQPILPGSMRARNIGDKIHKAASVLSVSSIDELYLGLVSHWIPGSIVIGGIQPKTFLNAGSLSLPGLDPIQRMMLIDALTYLPDDILTKVDRASMGVSLECRVPFLDHRIIEFAWRLPQDYKLRDGVGKWALRQVLYRHVPKELIERPKMGFGVPIDTWLRGPLRDWAEALLDERRLLNEGYFEARPIRQKWDEHLSGQRNWQYHLWDILMFQSWLEAQK